MASELQALGLEVDEDDAGAEIGADAGNLLARIPGAGEASVLICAHLDTVPPVAPVEPVLVDGGWSNANDGDPRRRQQGGGRDRCSSSPVG